MVFNATFNNISVLSWRSVLLVEETNSEHIIFCGLAQRLGTILNLCITKLLRGPSNWNCMFVKSFCFFVCFFCYCCCCFGDILTKTTFRRLCCKLSFARKKRGHFLSLWRVRYISYLGETIPLSLASREDKGR